MNMSCKHVTNTKIVPMGYFYTILMSVVIIPQQPIPWFFQTAKFQLYRVVNSSPQENKIRRNFSTIFKDVNNEIQRLATDYMRSVFLQFC